jgi:UDP-2,4-diacetamido-2,4,6-trideoxy-beta-L-altropyranose hydrolase
MENSNILTLRKANINDESLLLNWANDLNVRKWSFNNSFITKEEHKVWFKQRIDDDHTIIWILEKSNTPAGMVRLKKKEDKILLNYLIAPHSRGQRFASKMLYMAMEELFKYWKNIKVAAYTMPKNIASIKSLEKAGFTMESSSAEKNCYVFNKVVK